MENILEIEGLKRYFKLEGGMVIKAVDNVSIKIKKGEIISLVGESGSGKSTFLRSIVGLNKGKGNIKYKNLIISDPKIYKKYRKKLGLEIQMIFQDTTSSLNSRMKIKDIIIEPMLLSKMYSKEEMEKTLIDVLYKVGLNENYLNGYPYDFSGGERQRINIARAIVTKPKLLIADEAIASLDVSMQGKIVNLLKKLRDENGISILFTTHDLSMARYISDRIAVMNEGKIIEVSLSENIFKNPKEIYTKKLVESVLYISDN